jgi:hypothetical protein
MQGDEYSDVDGDGLADICESSLAQAFNPELRYCSCDAAWGGEPVYVATKVLVYTPSAGVQYVARIMYMPAYYNDAGDATDGCWYGFFNDPLSWFGQTGCSGHHGDSEAIVLDVRYESTSTHWVLNAAYLSQHTSYQWFYAGSSGSYSEDDNLFGDAQGNVPTPSQYPAQFGYYNGVSGGAPIVWVAIDKHANYASEADCNSGGKFSGHDSCQSNNSFAFMSLSDGSNGQRNLGSSLAHLLDCLPSNNPAVQINNHSECFWENFLFTGWSGAQPAATPYLKRLDNSGF